MPETISREDFEKRTSLLVWIFAEEALSKKFPLATPEQQFWFETHSEWRVRYLFTNDKVWKGRLTHKGLDPRPFLRGFVFHWAEGFAKHPTDYISRNKDACQDFPDPEWKKGGILNP